MSDKAYHTRKNMSWADVKRAMSRVKKFRKSGFYLEVEEQEGIVYTLSYATPENLYRRSMHRLRATALYTTRLWGPAKS